MYNFYFISSAESPLTGLYCTHQYSSFCHNVISVAILSRMRIKAQVVLNLPILLLLGLPLPINIVIVVVVVINLMLTDVCQKPGASLITWFC